MQIEISHVTEYSYSNEVFFEPHYLRLKPKVTPHSSIVSFDMQIEPKPSGFSDHVDAENNPVRFCWFEGMHQKLSVTVKSVLNVEEFNPFNFLVHPPEYIKIPFLYDEHTNQLLQPYLQTKPLTKVMKGFVDKMLKETAHQTIPFVSEMTKTIHKDFVVETREIGSPYEIEFTFEQKLGSCRDLVWMQIHLLRNIGIAARFVSGYFYLDSDDPQFELHAWLEVFLPGAGWIGFDPSHGIITGSYHIPLASSAFYENTMPVSGSIRGIATATLENDLVISVVS